MSKERARDNLINHGVPLDADFHRLDSSMVEQIIAAAQAHGYRKPKNANGSRARCFYEYANR